MIFFFTGTSSAHNGSVCRRAFITNGKPVLWPDAPRRPFDVLKYQLTLDWQKMFETKSPAFTGINIITVQLTEQTPLIELDASYMYIDSISINGSPLRIVPQPDTNEKLFIPIPLSLQSSGQLLVIDIGYNRNSVKDTGIYFYPKGTYDAYQKTSTTEDLAYTMSEPIDAHYWMPCMDLPYDKAESEISIIVPNGIEAASNGTLVSKQSYSPTSTIWHWKSDEPIATYLMVADASPFIHWSETHNRTNAPGDTVHLDFYAWPSDYYQDSIIDHSAYNATFFLKNTSQIMSWFEAKYGAFPFVKYGQVPVQPFIFGGMEHQTLTTIHRGWLKGYDEEGIAHEMSHQWFGDKTTCETFKDIWLNEGFATFSEAIYTESWGGNIWYMNTIRSKAAGYFYDTLNNKLPTYDPPADDLFNYALTYCKGGCVLHMLRRMVNNDTLFFNSLRDYSNAFAFTTANTAQFRDYIGQRLGLDLYEYFDQWIFGPQHPQYDIKWGQSKDNTLYIRMNQTQTETIRDHFTMPVNFFVFHGSATDTIRFENDLRSQEFQKSLNYTVDSLKFDDDALILSTYITASGDTVNISPIVRSTLLPISPELAVRSASQLSSLFTVYPEDGELLCKFNAPVSGGTIELYNSVGMKILGMPVIPGENLIKLNTHNLSSGIYFVRYTNSSTNELHSVNFLR